MKYSNLIQVSQHFKDEKVCRKHLEKLRWDNKPVCPFCNHDKIYRTKAGFKCGNTKCYKKFTVTVGTFFENTKIQLSKWFIAMYLLTAHKKGISSLQLSKDLGVTQKTAWFMLHRIRLMMKDKAPLMLTGIIELDETFIGGQNKNRHKSKQIENTQGRSVKDKSAVFGLYQRNGNIVSKPVKDTTKASIHPLVNENVAKGCKLISDEWTGYIGLNKEYNHNVVKHSQGQYVVGDAHTNSLEGFWSLLKRGIIGIYHQVSEKHLEKYCNEFNFRYNSRFVDEADRFDKSISQCKGRLKYKDLIAPMVGYNPKYAQKLQQLSLFN